MAKPKRTKLQREKDMERLSAMILEEKPKSEIAEALDVCRQQVDYDVKKLRVQWRENSLANFEEKLANALASIRHLKHAHWVAWYKSQEVRETTTQTTEKKVSAAAAGDEGGASSPLRQKAELKKEGREGNPAFLAGVARCIEMECELFGLNAKKGIDLHHSGSIAMTTQERLDLVTEVRKKLEPFPEARACLESLFQPSTNGD
jgi:predicted DNA-binding protein YlxM (UPF0122 family)